MATLENDGNLDRATEVEGYKVLPPCVLYGKIGQGGMGAVYRGRHLNLDIDVAVKCLKPGLVGSDDQFVVRFRREARAAAQINHQNVIRVYDVAEDQGLHYLIMELVQGETARERVVRKQKLAVGEALEIVHGAAQGLAEAHRKGFIHRDIKPDNIMISSGGQVKVADLGLAKPSIRDDNASLLSGTNLVMGTPQYMPPEQWENTTNVTPAADVWALGATLYYLLVGGEAIQKDSLPKIMQRIMLQPFPDPRRARPDVPEDVAALIAKATATAVADRYQTAQDLADAIEHLATRRAGLRDKDAVSTSKVENLVSPPPAKTLAKIKFWLDTHGQEAAGAAGATAAQGPGGTMVVSGTQPVMAPLSVRKSPVKWIAAGVGLVAVVAVAVMLWSGGGRRGTGAFAEADRLEGLGQYEAAIAEATRVHTEDPSLLGRSERLARLTAAFARELAVRAEWQDALVQVERSLGYADTPAARQQKKDLLGRIRTALEAKLERIQPDAKPVADPARVEFTGRLADPIVSAIRVGGAMAVLQSGSFRVVLDATGKAQVPVEVTLTSGDSIELGNWNIVLPTKPVELPAAALTLSPDVVTIEDDKAAELVIRVGKSARVTVDGAVQKNDDGVVRYQVRSADEQPKPIAVAVHQEGCTDVTRSVEVRRAAKGWTWSRAVEVAGGRMVGNQFVTKDDTVHLVGRPSEPGATVLVDGKATNAKWNDAGGFDVEIALGGKGMHTVRVELQKKLRPALTQEVAIVVVGEPAVELAPPCKNGDKTNATTYTVALSVDPWTTTVAARRGGVLVKTIDVPAGTSAAKIDVGLQPGSNQIELEAVNVVGLHKVLALEVERTVPAAPGGGQPADTPTEVAEIESVFVVIAGEERLVPKNGTIRVPTGARFRVVSSDATANVLCKDRELSGDDFLLAPTSFVVSTARSAMPELRLRNAVGVSKGTYKFKVVFDDQPPEFTVASPTAPVGANTPFKIQGTWTDNCAVARITVNGRPATGADERAERGRWTIEMPGISEAVEWEVVVTDVAGNTTKRTLKFTP